MKRDLNRILDDVKNSDIIYRKSKIKEIFNNDPDIKDILGQLPPRPLNKYADPANPTEEELEERRKIREYNDKVAHSQIISFLKVNAIQTEVQNFIMFDIADERASYSNELIKHQIITVMILVQEDDMETEYGIDRADLLSYIVKDLLCWSNETGLHYKLESDTPAVTESTYYMRTLKFLVKTTNTNNFRTASLRNSYEQG